MKRTTGLIAALFAGALIFSCANGLDSSAENSTRNSREAAKTYKVDEKLAPVADGYLRINTLLTDAKDLWIWNDFDPSATALCKNWTEMAFPIAGKNGDFVYADIKLQDAPQQVSFILRKDFKDEGKLTGDITFLFPAKYNEIFLKDGSGTIYIDSDLTKEPSGLASATVTGENTISATIKGITLSKENTKVLEADGTTEIEITSINVSESEISVSKSLKETGSVYVQYTDDNGTDKRVANFDSTLIDEWFDVDETTIAKFGYKNGVFTTWAPLSSSAKVLLFESADTVSGDGYKVAEEIPMKRNADGTWQTENVSSTVGSNKYYKYSFMTNGVQYDVCDIWAKSASKDSVASAIDRLETNGNYKNPFGNSGSESKKYNDAVIYEMHITDWSQAFRSSVEEDKPGTFREITEALGANGSGPFGQHLKELGVTHVQILPMFEYAVTTKSAITGKDDVKDVIESSENDNAYNWGYNPYNWNTPESRYVQNMNDGSDAVEQMREMINAFHDAGISVIMDVVYNHTAGTGNGSIYDMTVPKYFYRMDSQGNYSNGSGCGNETASEHAMVRKYMIDSLKHWINDYHINGFRFDLMGLHDKDTMKEIYDELSSIDKNVLVYGEPWDAGSNASSKPLATSAIDEGTWGVGAFDDNFRDAVKGGEYGGFQLGQVQSANSDREIASGLIGANNNRNSTGISGLALHYAECHDNYTLFDKLVYSLEENFAAAKEADSNKDGSKIATTWPTAITEKQIELIKKEEKLAAAYVLLSQGTPFINGGQEFMRTKKGNPDSYAADNKGGVFWSNIDECNAIDLKMKKTYSDVYNVYRGLISLRKKYNAFTDGTKSTAKTLAKGVTLYNAKSDSCEFEVYFNASDKDFTIPSANLRGNLGLGFDKTDISFGVKGKVVDVSSGKEEIAETETLVQKIPAKSFVILMK